MTLKPLAAFGLSLLLFSSCNCTVRNSGPSLSSLETSAKATTVSTVSGPVAGYIDDGVFIYKGIPYAKAERFMPPTHLQKCL